MSTILVALHAMTKNKMRCGLTVLGVVIGIAAVTTMVSVGESASTLLQNTIQSLGTNVIIVTPARLNRRGIRQGRIPTLTAGDARAIKEECPDVASASPLVGMGGQLIHGNNNWNPKEMFGVGEDYLTVRDWPIRHGGFFGASDVNSAQKVCVVGITVMRKLFQTSNPLGKVIRIKVASAGVNGNIPFRIIGVLEPKGANMFGDDQDDIVLIPYTTVRKRLQGSTRDDVHAIMVSARTTKQMNDAGFQIDQLLQDRHQIAPGEPRDFEVQNTKEIAAMMDDVMGIMTLLLSAIAGISLLVGGVGIMNVMLVSVTERTREIGIRMAVGARGRDILRQFLVESILLATVGGLLGLTLGVSASVGATLAINAYSGSDWPIVISMRAAMVAMGFAAAVGIFFGYYPARRASRLDPIEALRYE